MSKLREDEVVAYLKKERHSPQLMKLAELLTLNRAKCLDRLESEDSPETRGRSKHCRELLKLLTK